MPIDFVIEFALRKAFEFEALHPFSRLITAAGFARRMTTTRQRPRTR
jgi:hypothetical protein